ncbi:hypothetical protein OPT61_g3788 [Boeremia exigua]|uniref:Uncharacterized protein n=1 Tax=Boeremia exigua TaxID=749465 RepID=A0ACC2IGJ3_9PLEO|nr:hypothetical protein OPT61_g3788 [Boeremia exigua]
MVKEEPGRLLRGAHSNENAQRQGSTRSRDVPQQQQGRINPQHVKRIIDTSGHHALRSVVLQLCKTSPALSGAIVRGLAPHSPWAQALMRGQQAKLRTQTQHTIKAEPRANEQAADERVKKQLGSSSNAQSLTPQNRTNHTNHADRTPRVHENRDGLRLPPSSQKAPNVKREHRPSPTDSDDSTNIVGFSAIDKDTGRQRSNHSIAAPRDSRHHSATNHGNERQAIQQRSTRNAVTDQKPGVCLQCGEMLEETGIECYFHTGQEAPARPGDIPQYTCCNRFVGEPGCKVGRHIDSRAGTVTNAKRPSPSHHGSQWSKKPRVLSQIAYITPGLTSLAMLMLLVIAALAVAASPFPYPQSWRTRDNEFYSLRANWFVNTVVNRRHVLMVSCSPDEPWHGRHLVDLPTGDRLGLENFTVNPETPPLRFTPVRIRNDDNRYALRGDGVGDDLSRIPYLAALINRVTRTVSMKIVYLPTPLQESFETQTDACLQGYSCTADQWFFSDVGPISGPKEVYRDFRFGGFRGRWELFKDAGREGWHVYWKGAAGTHRPVQFDLVSVV